MSLSNSVYDRLEFLLIDKFLDTSAQHFLYKFLSFFFFFFIFILWYAVLQICFNYHDEKKIMMLLKW